MNKGFKATIKFPGSCEDPILIVVIPTNNGRDI